MSGFPSRDRSWAVLCRLLRIYPRKLHRQETAMKAERFYVDILGYTFAPKLFIPREVAIIHRGQTVTHAFFSQPVRYRDLKPHMQRHINWWYKRVHGLRWDNDDGLPQETLGLLLHKHIPDGSITITYSTQKSIYLSKIGPAATYVTLERLGCPVLSHLQTENRDGHCDEHHYVTSRCALENAINMHKWAENKVCYPNKT
jgi:hypothetical protein